jgi:hypothetical protein
VPVTTLTTNDAPENTPGEIQLLESKEYQSTDAEVGDEIATTKLPDLANSAVVAIHNLAIVPPTTKPIQEVVKNTSRFRGQESHRQNQKQTTQSEILMCKILQPKSDPYTL